MGEGTDEIVGHRYWGRAVGVGRALMDNINCRSSHAYERLNIQPGTPVLLIIITSCSFHKKAMIVSTTYLISTAASSMSLQDINIPC